MKVFLNRKPVLGPWGGGNQWVRAFWEHAPSMGVQIVDRMGDSDVVLLVGMDRGDTGVCILDVLSSKHRIVTRVNENDARKGTKGVDDFMGMSIMRSDGVVFVSNWIRDYYRDKVLSPEKLDSATVVVNGVDRNVFCPYPSIRLYDCSLLRIVAHHWSDNPMKGADVYEFLDRYCDDDKNGSRFHYIGRHRPTLKGKNTYITPPCHGHELGKALGDPTQAHNVYISGSRFDPGPNHILEALACGLEVWVHADGGGSVEFAGQNHAFRTEEELVKVLERKSYGLSEPNTFVPPTWRDCIQSYVDYMETLL